MNIFRRLSSRSLAALALASAAVAALGATIAVAAFGGAGVTPPEPLDQAIHAALSATPPQGLSAQVSFTNNLFASGGLGSIAALIGSPLLSGGNGRLWSSGDHMLRIELPTDQGATEIVLDGSRLSVYDSSSNTAYELTLPTPAAAPTTAPAVPALSEIDSALTALAHYASVSAATPDSVSGQPAYTVSVAPLESGGLLGSASLSVDAQTGVPLRFALDARGSGAPVLALTLSSVDYASVPSSDVLVSPPAGARIVDVSLPAAATPAAGAAVSGLDAVARALSFPLVAPATLDGLARGEVRLTGSGASAGALLSYGQGLGTLLVSERPLGAAAASHAALFGLLPAFSIDGASGHELVTALGTVVEFERSGVSYVLAGSVGQADAEAAARALGS
jgi:outer membrane lipoprotein-sorting protein